ncbi:MAG: LLM class flavin-dependent oxidoreductase [Candidatus Binataceae bacterium]|nr:LLM class flavin-dependent oxidoreductase [Candidatus Binataceae bacterium]
MDVGIGLPTHIPNVEGKNVIEWARRAEARNFKSLAVIDRIVYGSYEPLIALGAAAAVTERIRLITTIILGPIRTNTALFAKQIATLDALSNGRFELGIAVGQRTDDYSASGAEFNGRGKALDRQLAEMRQIWAGESRGMAGAIGPTPKRKGGPLVILGGHSEPAFKRAARIADGWIMGGNATPEGFQQAADQFKSTWTATGRKDKPRMLALLYFALGSDALRGAQHNVRDYYGFAGPYADQVAAGILSSETQIAERIAGLEQVGCDELVLIPGVPDIGQVDLLAAAAFGKQR